MSKAEKKPRKKVNGYQMPEPLPKGEILTETNKQKWRIGVSIGIGGFGEIYCAQEEQSKNSKEYPYVVKIEPQENGPLFVEMHCYRRIAQRSDVEEFKKQRKLSSLGMPIYFGSGLHEYGNKKYRFLVMEKFGTDIWKLFLENKRCFPTATVFKIGVHILDVLEYIHSKGYVHADIKGANILLGATKNTQNQTYLVDFGLCTRIAKEFKPDRKKAHDGTIEYLSRDAHLGVQGRRGDLEILGYNLVQWLGCVLPWEKSISNPVTVQQSKEKYMSDIPEFMKTCFGNNKPPAALVEYLNYIAKLKFETEPDYKKLRKILQSGIETAAGSIKSPLQFKTVKSPAKRKATAETLTPEKKRRLGRKILVNEDITPEDIQDQDKVKKVVKKTVVKKPATVKKLIDNEQSSEESSDSEKDGKSKEAGVPKLTKRKPIKQTDVSRDLDESCDNLNQSDGIVYNKEMLRLKNKIKARGHKTKDKAVKTTPVKAKKNKGKDKNDDDFMSSTPVVGTVTRNRKAVNYNEEIPDFDVSIQNNSKNTSHASTDIVSASENELDYSFVTKRRMCR